MEARVGREELERQRHPQVRHREEGDEQLAVGLAQRVVEARELADVQHVVLGLDVRRQPEGVGARARRVFEPRQVELWRHVPLVVGTAAHRQALALAEGDDLERRGLLLVLVDVVLRRELPLEVGLCVVVVAEAREDVVVDARDVLEPEGNVAQRAVLLKVVDEELVLAAHL